jgi:hypothetical protein
MIQQHEFGTIRKPENVHTCFLSTMLAGRTLSTSAPRALIALIFSSATSSGMMIAVAIVNILKTYTRHAEHILASYPLRGGIVSAPRGHALVSKLRTLHARLKQSICLSIHSFLRRYVNLCVDEVGPTVPHPRSLSNGLLGSGTIASEPCAPLTSQGNAILHAPSRVKELHLFIDGDMVWCEQ